jgi:hypothetical protein
MHAGLNLRPLFVALLLAGSLPAMFFGARPTWASQADPASPASVVLGVGGQTEGPVTVAPGEIAPISITFAPAPGYTITGVLQCAVTIENPDGTGNQQVDQVFQASTDVCPSGVNPDAEQVSSIRGGKSVVRVSAQLDVTETATGQSTEVAVTDTFVPLLIASDAPTFTSIPNVTVGATSNYGAVVAYALPAATDDFSTPTVSCSPPPGSRFPIGTSTVNCTASDGVNQTPGSFTVTVTPNGFREPREPRPGASPQTEPQPLVSPRPSRPSRPVR